MAATQIPAISAEPALPTQTVALWDATVHQDTLEPTANAHVSFI